jgi:hypothetical protein
MELLSKFEAVLLVACVAGLIFLQTRTDPQGLQNPSLKQLMVFLNKAQTHLVKYDTNGTYTCWFFARDFKAQANAAKLECALVYVIYYEASDGTSGHFVNAFNVTGSVFASAFGLTFVEPQSATIILLNVGAVYLNRTIVDLSVVW